MKYKRIIYYDSHCLAVINQSGEIRRLFTPFMVNCIKSIDDIEINSTVYVDQVFDDPVHLLNYLIGGKIYNYSNFRITINF